MMQNPDEIKERIISTLKSKGPSLPVHIAGEIKSSILFSSAFLGELVSEKKVKISHMRVGSSPLYFLVGQEPSLEKFFQHLRSKEKEAFLLLKEKKFLRDSAQNPAIRVALREIRDFALPFKSGEEIIWRYFLVPESEFKITEKKPEKLLEIEVKKPVLAVAEKETQKPLDIFSKESKEEPETKPKKRKSYKRRTPGKENEFLNSVKEFLSANSMDLLDTKTSGRREIILRIVDKGEEKLLVAYNKNKISGDDIIKASKKASKENLPYIVLGLGGPLKKIDSLIEALKGLSSIKKVK
ncbi:MAG TPA: hypothetical protein VJ142_01650 [Candidatus Nanoarchaeia archaeon]|nr:hypothetical protein [Candidatus Nanoarchaeia archaeon]